MAGLIDRMRSMSDALLRVLVVMSLAASVTAAWSGLRAEPAAAAQPGYTALTFNMWGNSGGSGLALNLPVAPALIVSIADRNPKPMVVSLQEVCAWHLFNRTGHNVSLVSYMSGQGYSLAARMTLPVASSGPPAEQCGVFGAAVFVRGPKLGEFSTSYTPNGASNGWLTCAVVGSGFGPFSGCSAHLTNDKSKVDAQMLQVIGGANNLQAFGPVIWGADANLDALNRNCEPNKNNYRTSVKWPLGSYAEARADGSTHADGVKTWSTFSSTKNCHLDYIYFQRSVWRPGSKAVSTSPYSDHKLYEATPGNR